MLKLIWAEPAKIEINYINKLNKTHQIVFAIYKIDSLYKMY